MWDYCMKPEKEKRVLVTQLGLVTQKKVWLAEKDETVC